jgi:hypothetical protein
VHLVGFIIEIYHDARPHERQTMTTVTRNTLHRHYAAKLAKDTGTIGFATIAITNSGQFSTAGANYLSSVSKASTFLANTSQVRDV